MDHHRGVPQRPQHCLLPPKAFHHDQHQQVKAHGIKPGVGREVGLRGRGTLQGHPFAAREKDSRERWGLLRGRARAGRSGCVTQEERGRGDGPQDWEKGNFRLWEQRPG